MFSSPEHRYVPTIRAEQKFCAETMTRVEKTNPETEIPWPFGPKAPPPKKKPKTVKKAVRKQKVGVGGIKKERE